MQRFETGGVAMTAGVTPGVPPDTALTKCEMMIPDDYSTSNVFKGLKPEIRQ